MTLSRWLLFAVLLTFAPSVEAANLCVKSGGSDATAKASISYSAGNEAGSTCWQTIGRAAWGSTTRSSPSSGEAVAAGDTVYVFGATYTTTATHNIDEYDVYYRPINTGTGTADANRIRFVCIGDCTLVGTTLTAPIVGSGDAFATTNNYITWYADISLGYSWIVNSCQATGTCPAGSVKTLGDTGPVICHGTGTHLEGFVITSVVNAPEDNYNAIKGLGCDASLIRNNTISGFAIDISAFDDGHASCFQIYQSIGSTFEHNDCRDSQVFFIFKDNGAVGNTGGGNIIRYNYIQDVNTCFTMSHADAGETASFFYQNICNHFKQGLNIKTTHLSADEFVNNTFYNGSGANARGVWTFGGGGPTGMIIWNNIGLSLTQVVANEAAGYTEPGTADFQHNIWFTFTDYGSHTDGGTTFSFATWLSNTTGDDETTPATTSTTDPLLADAAGGDFRHCTAAATPHASCSGASPAINFAIDRLDLNGDLSTTDNVNAGAYITGSEVIGLTTDPPPDPPATAPAKRLRLRGDNLFLGDVRNNLLKESERGIYDYKRQ